MRYKVHDIDVSNMGPRGQGSGITYKASISKESSPGRFVFVKTITVTWDVNDVHGDPWALVQKAVRAVVEDDSEIIWPRTRA